MNSETPFDPYPAPFPSAAPNQRALLQALREADLEHWEQTGGDFLASTRGTQVHANARPARFLLLAGTAAVLLAGCTGSTAGSPARAAPPLENPRHPVAPV